MNRSEFAALISSTMGPQQHSSTPVRAQHPAPSPHSHLPLDSQGRLHNNVQYRYPHTRAGPHGHTRQARSEADAQALPAGEPRSTRALHASHGHSYSYLPQVNVPQIVTPPVEHGILPRRTRKSMVAEVEEPDFVREEREAWSKKSPKTKIDFYAAPAQPPSYIRATRASCAKSDNAPLHPPILSKALPPQPHKHSKQNLPLRDFAPTPQDSDFEERPKTSRGPSSSDEEASLRSSEDSQVGATTQQKPRRSKFLEGSLNERSAAVASSWYDNDSVSGDSYDSDATPRASKDTFGSGSFESTESKPLPVTPATVKAKKPFKLKSSIKSRDDVNAVKEPEIPKRRGLRKSLSTWNFHNLGDKMKIFGSSNNDLTPKAPQFDKQQRPSKNSSRDSVKDVLDERKRKAEEAYSQQFVLKKQKSNAGIANTTQPPEAPNITKPSSLKRRTPSSSSQTSSASYWNRATSSSTSPSFASDQSASDIDKTRRPSRKELEKENQHLRRMLRQSSSTHIDGHRSSVHLPLVDAPAYNDPPRPSQEDFAQGHKVRILPGKRMGRRGEDVPPMPKLSREVLGSLENGWHTRAKIDGKGLLPRPVSMILEEEECRDGNERDNGKMQMSPVQEQWEWPDDVF